MMIYIVSNTKVGAAKDHGENYMKVKPPLVRHLQPNRLLCVSIPETLLHLTLKRQADISADSFAQFFAVFSLVLQEFD